MLDGNRLLILKSNGNSFEQYFSKRINAYGIEVFPVFKEGISRSLWEWRARKILDYIYPTMERDFSKDWWDRIGEYDQVIIFDSNASIELCRRIKQKAPNTEIKLWMWNIRDDFPTRYFKYAKVYSFDESFCKQYPQSKFANQFYFPYKEFVDKKDRKVFFVGIDKGRSTELRRIARMLEADNISHQLYVVGNDSSDSCDSIYHLDHFMEYETVLNRIEEVSCILELVRENQSGLTIRTMEALFYKRKLITNNASICNHGFYNPANVFIIGKDDESRIADFMDTPYQSVPPEEIEQYSFEMWLRKLME